MTATAPLLVLGVGNPSRGDDALGPLFLERAGGALGAAIAAGSLELLTDFQLQIEHALDLVGRARVLFVDASVRVVAPFVVRRLEPAHDASATSHALSPAEVLETHRRIVGPPPEAWLLAIRGESFELGAAPSAAASAHLEVALEWFVTVVREGGPWAAVGEG